MNPRELEQFHTFEHLGWQSISSQYDSAFCKLTTQCIPKLLDSADIQNGTKVLDVCTGPGFAAAAAAKRSAEVIGLDFSSQMILLARQKHPELDFRVGNAQVLPFTNERFDSVIMNFGLLHIPDPVKAISEAHRVLKPGGKFITSVWATPDRSVGFGIVLSAIERFGNGNTRQSSAPDFFKFSAPKFNRAIFTSAGYLPPVVEEASQIWRIENEDEVFNTMYHSTVRTAALLKSQSERALKKIRSEIAKSVRQYETPSGFEIPMPAIVTAAEKKP